MASLSDTPRRLGSESGRLRRIARQVRRDGGNPQSILIAAAEAKMGERGITSAESNAEEQKLQERLDRGLLETRRRSLLGGGTAPNTGDGPTPRSGATPAPLTPGSSQPRTTGSQEVDTFVGPPAPARPRVGRINGQPAGGVLSSMRGAQQPGFSSALGERNLSTMGLEGAVADYQKRADAQDNPISEPGNLREAQANLGIPVMSEFANLPNARSSPLQDALNAARARREASQPMVSEAAPASEPAPMNVGGVPVRGDFGIPREGASSAATPGPTSQPPAASVAPMTPPAASRPTVSFRPMDESQSELAIQRRRKQEENARARQRMGDSASIPSRAEGTGVGGLLKFLQRPRL